MTLLEKELHQLSMEDQNYVSQPSNAMEIFQKMYPSGYKAPLFALLGGREGNLRSMSIDL